MVMKTSIPLIPFALKIALFAKFIKENQSLLDAVFTMDAPWKVTPFGTQNWKTT